MKKSSAKTNIIFNMLKTFMGILFPFISFPYAARILGSNNLGLVQYASSIVSYFALFAELGILIYATREGVKYRDDKKEMSIFVKEILMINIITTALSYLCLGVLLICGMWKDYRIVIFVCSSTILFSTFRIDWLYQILEEFKYICIRSVILQFVSIVLLFLFVRDKSDYLQYAGITVFAAGGTFIFNFLHSHKYIDWGTKIKIKNIKRHLRPVIIVFGITAAAQIYLNLDAVMIGAIRGTKEVGLYSASIKLINAFKTLFASVNIAILARLSAYANSNNNNFSLLIENVFNITMSVLIPLSAGIILFRHEILYYLYGSEYASASISLSLLAINMIFSVVDGILYQQVCLPLKMEKQACIATFTGAMANFCLNLIFIHLYGFNGGAFTTLISEIIVYIILMKYVKSYISDWNLFSKLYQYILITLLLAFLAFIVKGNKMVGLFPVIIVTVVLFTAYYFMLVMIKNEYILQLISYAKSIWKIF